MPIGLGTAIVIGAGVAGGVGVYSANKAAGAQQDATDKSLALQKTMYDTTRADLSPYTQAGTAALGNLRQLVGLPAGAPAGGGSPSAPVAGAKVPPPGAPIVGQAVPRNSGSGFVTMVGPDGSVNQVDQAHVAYYQNLGAKVMNASGFDSSPQAVAR